MGVRIDLHTHSEVSDGTDSPGELVRAAAAAGLDVVALTDHDTTRGWAEAAAAAEEVGIGFVPGLEISTRHRGRGVHLLAYWVDPADPSLAASLSRILDGRSSRVPAILALLRGLGIELDVADVRLGSRGAAALGRPHVADALVRAGVVTSRGEAFARFLNPGRPAYVNRYAAPLEVMVRQVSEAGGVSVLAHPWGRHGRSGLGEAELAALRDLGLIGLEVDHQDHDPRARADLTAVARSLGLVATGSSDYHGTGKVAHDLGCNTTAPEEYARLRDAASAVVRGPAPDHPRQRGPNLR